MFLSSGPLASQQGRRQWAQLNGAQPLSSVPEGPGLPWDLGWPPQERVRPGAVVLDDGLSGHLVQTGASWFT